MKIADFNFLGRPDGIGNRIEEIITIGAICQKEKLVANYIWRNTNKYRSYDIFFKTNLDNVKLSGKATKDLPNKSISDIQNTNLSQKEILVVAKKIEPCFNIYFKNYIKPVGIHIRGTDRIKNNDHPHFMKNKREFLSYLSNTILKINKECPNYVYICSDDSDYRNAFINKLDKNIIVVKPICDKGIPDEYIDFFALTKCEKIYMCSKFSSFAITASLIGNIPVVSFFRDEEVAKRYKALFHYEPDIPVNNNILLHTIPSFQRTYSKMLFKRLLNMCRYAFKHILHNR